MDFHTFQSISNSVCRCVSVELCTFIFFSVCVCVCVCDGSCVKSFLGLYRSIINNEHGRECCRM
jgi:hypothetical protein